MRVSIWFSGAAGSGVNTSGMLLWQLLAKKGYCILADKEYASIIKGDNNDFFLYISDTEYFITQTIDYFFAFDEYAVSKNQKLYTLKQTYMVKDQDIKFKNVFCFGAALKILGIPLDEGKALLSQSYTWDVLVVNLDCLQKGYAYITEKSTFQLKDLGVEKKFFFGNEVVGNGAIASGLEFYSAYPMTPASSLIEVISADKKVTFLQWEDEIAVSMSMLGAKYAGKRAMCGTSGGGFALMTESISFSHQAEIGGVYILVQRDGPSTGTPTFTGQSDLNYALHASFGDTFPIVLAPSTYQEWYNLIGKALNRSDIYQHPVIVLYDKQFAEWYMTIDPKTLAAEPILRGEVRGNNWKFEWEYKRYEITKSGISSSMRPGTENGEFISTSYEHDEYGVTNEDPVIKKQQQDKRMKKLDTFIQQEFTKDFYGYEIINPDAENFFITFGFNRFVLEDFMRWKEKWKRGIIVIKVFQPLDMRLKEFLDSHVKKIKNLTFVEMNASGQMQEWITNKCLLHDATWEGKIKSFRKYTLYPIYLEELGM